jgi:N-acetylglucosamine-6-sulfatase
MDRLAKEGARFKNMFVTTSLCSPSRASFMSGLYANTHGVTDNFTHFPDNLPSFPKRLHKEGYHTAYVGKWHMGQKDDSKRPGFDYWVSHKGQGSYFDPKFNVDGNRRVVEGYYTNVVTDFATDWLTSDHEDRPFLLMLGHKAPHTPFTPEPKYQDLYEDVDIGYPRSAFHLEDKPSWIQERIDTWHGVFGPIYGFREDFPDRSAESVVEFDEFIRSYTATLKSVDDSLGRIYQTLKQMGELNNTIIIFTGDNGMFLGEHGMSDKRTMHEPSIRVPLLVRYPKLIRPGTVIPQQVLNIDMAPSILDLVNAEPIENVHGRSWVPLLKGKTKNWRDAWYYEYNYEPPFPYTPNVRGIRTQEWKYMYSPPGDGSEPRYKAELYHLPSDPGEKHNLIDDPRYEDVVKRLKKRLNELMAEHNNRSLKKMPVSEGVKDRLPPKDVR